MAEEMIVENVSWESDEAEDWESDEAIVEAEEAAEDIGERAQRRGGRRGYPTRRFRHIRRPVRGITVGGQKMPFPRPLATAEDTNRGLASQEVARRAVEERLARVETRSRVQQKNDMAATGIVTLLISGGLSAWGAYQASQKSGTSMLGKWADEDTTKMAAVTSVSQIAMSGAKLALNGRYHRNGFGIAADAFSAVQLAAFAFGRMYKPRTVATVDTWNEAWRDRDTYDENGEVFVIELKKSFLVVGAKGPTRTFRPLA